MKALMLMSVMMLAAGAALAAPAKENAKDNKTAYTASSFLALTGDLGSINAYFSLYDKVTSADVKRVAAKLFTPANRTVVTMKAEKP